MEFTYILDIKRNYMVACFSLTAKVLSALGLNLSNKAETYSDQYLKPIFMLNNFNYILKSLRR